MTRMKDPDAPVELANFYDVHQADFVVSVLAGNGVDAYIDSPHTGAIAPYYLIGTGGVRVFVRARDLDRAREVLEAIDTDPAEELDESDED